MIEEASDPMAGSRYILMSSRSPVTNRMTQTNQAVASAAPRGMRSYSESPIGVQKAIRVVVFEWMVT